MAGLNGSTGTVYSALAGAAAVGSILFAQVYRAIDDLQEDIRAVATSARDARKELRDDLVSQFAEVHRMFALRGGMIESNKSSIQVIEAKLVEVETQFNAASTVGNLEKQYERDLLDLLQQCPSCRVPERKYYPPGPGPENITTDTN